MNRGLFTGGSTDLIALFRLLGPSVLRLGGNYVDLTSWTPTGSGGTDTEIAPPDVDALAAFVEATGWKVLYGIRVEGNSASSAAAEAAYAAQALGSSLLAFEIGNEPNHYPNGQNTETLSAYESTFTSFVSAIKAQVPNAAFDGPGPGHDVPWAVTFA
jgi:hypothetical protein